MTEARWTTLGVLLKETGGSIKTGPFGTALKAAEYSAQGAPVISVGEVGYGSLRITDSTRRVGPKVVRRLSEYVLRSGDIVFGRKGAVDRSAHVREAEDGSFLGSDGIRVRFGVAVDSRFMVYQIQSAHIRDWIVQHAIGTTMPSLNQAVLRRMPIRVPPIEEQRAVAEMLADIDEFIASLGLLIAKKRAVKQGIMQQLLTGRTRLPGFRGAWNDVTIESLMSPARERVDPHAVSAGTRLIELEHLESATGRLCSSSTASTAVSLKSVFRPGDILFGKLRAYLRKYWLADTSGLCSTEFWVLRPKADNVSEYVRYIVEADSFVEVASGGYGTHMPRADWGMVRRIPICIPEAAEQHAIADVLMDTDREIDALQGRLDKARALKQGMMQQLLTGRIRLPI